MGICPPGCSVGGLRHQPNKLPLLRFSSTRYYHSPTASERNAMLIHSFLSNLFASLPLFSVCPICSLVSIQHRAASTDGLRHAGEPQHGGAEARKPQRHAVCAEASSRRCGGRRAPAAVARAQRSEASEPLGDGVEAGELRGTRSEQGRAHSSVKAGEPQRQPLVCVDARPVSRFRGAALGR